MNRNETELMLEHVKSVYQAITGSDFKEQQLRAPLPPGVDVGDLILARFAELEALRRLIPTLAVRIPPFGFVPPVDVIDAKGELLVELAVPGVTAANVEARVMGDILFVSGTRNEHTGATERPYRHAEIPRGPFRRMLVLPPDVASEPIRIEAQNGIVRLHLRKVGAGAVATA